MDNRENILDVSLDLFYQKGYDAVSVQEIVEQAGVTKPTLYYYFGSKHGLLEALLENGFYNFNQYIEPALQESDADVRTVLFDVTKAFLSFVTTNYTFFSFMISLMYSPRENEAYLTVKPYLHKLYRSIINLFEREKQWLGNMNGRQEQFAMGFLGFLNQFAFTFLEKQYQKGEAEVRASVTDEEVGAVVQQFMYGIVS